MALSLPPLAITGSTGELGGRVAARLAALGYPQRLLVRDPARAPHLNGAEVFQAAYTDGPAMQAALRGVQTLFLVSGYGAARLEEHYRAVDAALAVGVERIVYTSFLAAAPLATFTHSREHALTEQYIRATGLRSTFLRPGFYLDSVPGWFSAEGIIRGPAGHGTIAWISRADLADVAAAVLTTEGHDGASYDVTGGEALTLTEVARQLAQVSGRSTAYVVETLEEARASRAHYQPTAWELEAWVSTYSAIATGEMSIVSHTVQALTGHAPQTLRAYLALHPESYRHIISALI